jgi:hypothetical protein
LLPLEGSEVLRDDQNQWKKEDCGVHDCLLIG